MLKPIRQIVRDIAQHWVGDGFPVRSLFSYSGGNQFDPFLLLDYAGPHQFPPSQSSRGVDEHPHRGFETVTIVYQGELEHRDSSGSHGSIGPGDVQWMTAASGIVHEEYHSEHFAREGGTLEMVQLWVNLPAKDKLSPPHYQGILDSQIPAVKLPNAGGVVRVIAGSFAGTAGPAKTFSPINVWDVSLEAQGTADMTIPSGHTALMVVQKGEIVVNESSAKAVELVAFDEKGDRVRISASAPARVLILTGEPLREPVVGQGPFVMNTRQQIQEAINEYQSGRMGRLT
jgi:redox-sensitive bicupin YhaK (pirin superfamily)